MSFMTAHSPPDVGAHLLVLRDTPMVLNVVVWILEVVFILYKLRPT